MYSLIRITVIAAAVATALTSVAQDPGLNTEISVDREIIPEHIDATRLSLTPVLSLPEVQIPKLQIADRTRATSIDPYVAALAPARYAMAPDTVPWRGYVEAGFLPVNYNLSAGYGFKVRGNTRVNAFMQFDGTRYKADIPVEGMGDVVDLCRDNIHRNALNLGVTSRTDFRNGGYLDAYIMAGGAAYNIPEAVCPDQADEFLTGSVSPFVRDNDADMRRVLLGMTFGARAGRWKVAGGLHYRYFSLGVSSDSRSENTFDIDLKPVYYISGASSAGMDVAIKAMGANAGFSNRGILHMAPHYLYDADQFKARLGVLIDAKLGNAKCPALFAPDIKLAWVPSAYFTLWGSMDGALDPNWLSSLYDFSPYLPWSESFGYSRVPVNTKIGVTIGPITGLSLELRAGFASVEDWLVYRPDRCSMSADDASSVSFGATLSYRYGAVFDMNISADFYNHPDGYGYPYHIGTTVASDIKLMWRPLNKLTLDAGFGYRQHDKALGDPINLSFGAIYGINDRLSAFARGENLTGSRYYIVYGIPAQRFHGLVGVTYMF